MQHDKILILDFGSQVTQLIARRVREAHVYCEVHPCDVGDDWVRDFAAVEFASSGETEQWLFPAREQLISHQRLGAGHGWRARGKERLADLIIRAMKILMAWDVPSEAELTANPRARSAKLRIFERCNGEDVRITKPTHASLYV